MMVRFVVLLLQLLSLVALCWSAAVPLQIPTLQEPDEYDAIIVGGGPSGLSALSGLARVRRKVLLIDSGEYRNEKTRHIHDILGFDGVTPAYYLWRARQQISHYTTVRLTNGTVTDIRPSSNNHNTTLFTVSTASSTHRARKVVLATGLRDELPPTPGLRENWARGIFWCPWCDGHEHADQALGLLGPLGEVPEMALETLTLNADVVAFANGTDTPAARAAARAAFPLWEELLGQRNIAVDNRTVVRIERMRDGGDVYDGADPALPSLPEQDRFRVVLRADGDADGGGDGEEEAVERAALLVAFPKAQASPLGERLGVRAYGGRLWADQEAALETNVPGVYAVGDANTDNSTNLPHALWSGKRAAVGLHVTLEQEDTEKLLDGTLAKRSADLSPRSVWESMNGEPGDIFYAGEFDP